MIDITNVDLVDFAKKVYELSVPQGLGRLQFTDEPLSDKEAKQIVALYAQSSAYALDMDYVKGRACKMTAFRNNGILQIPDSWYDHTDKCFDLLLNNFGIERNTKKEHGCACNCIDCQSARTTEEPQIKEN